ncbi:hypothetical protein IAD21_00988 [Abditibacteriota bacterium]|nr:hypothetical protein IAD21_00988 [Abditibacteriota bacterium]
MSPYNPSSVPQTGVGIKFKRAGLLCILAVVCLFLGSKAQAQDKWPADAPKIEGDDEYLSGLVYAPVAALPPSDPVQDVAKSFNEGGRLVYLINLVVNNRARWFFVFRDELSEAQAAQNPALSPSITSYDCFAPVDFAAPQFSPDLHILMFQSGNFISAYGTYTPCFWNFAEHTIAHTNNYITYPEVRFSPNSQYIGFYVGGDRYGAWNDDVPRLYAQNIHTGKFLRIALQEGLTTWEWTTKATILYSNLLTQSIQQRMAGYREAHQQPIPYDSEIREHNLSTGADKTVIAHASHPLPSPDNRFIVFDQCLEQQKALAGEVNPVSRKAGKARIQKKLVLAANRLTRTRLSLYSRQTKEAVALEAERSGPSNNEIPVCTWSQDSQKLVVTRFLGLHCSIKSTTLRKIYDGKIQPSPPLWKSVAEFDIPKHWPEGIILSTEVRKMTRNSRYLILNVSEFSGHQGNATFETLEAVDLESGTIKVLGRKPATLNNSMGWDWVELPQRKANEG